MYELAIHVFSSDKVYRWAVTFSCLLLGNKNVVNQVTNIVYFSSVTESLLGCYNTIPDVTVILPSDVHKNIRVTSNSWVSQPFFYRRAHIKV